MTRLEQAKKMLSAYIDAEMKVLEGKTVSLNGRMLSRESLNEIRKGRMEWEKKVAALENSITGKSKFKYVRLL